MINSKDLHSDTMKSYPTKEILKVEEKINDDKKSDQKEVLKPASFSTTQKNKNRIIEENKEISDFTTNKKLRNSIAGSSNTINYKSDLIDIILKVEKENEY